MFEKINKQVSNPVWITHPIFLAEEEVIAWGVAFFFEGVAMIVIAPLFPKARLVHLAKL